MSLLASPTWPVRPPPFYVTLIPAPTPPSRSLGGRGRGRPRTVRRPLWRGTGGQVRPQTSTTSVSQTHRLTHQQGGSQGSTWADELSDDLPDEAANHPADDPAHHFGRLRRRPRDSLRDTCADRSRRTKEAAGLGSAAPRSPLYFPPPVAHCEGVIRARCSTSRSGMAGRRPADEVLGCLQGGCRRTLPRPRSAPDQDREGPAESSDVCTLRPWSSGRRHVQE